MEFKGTKGKWKIDIIDDFLEPKCSKIEIFSKEQPSYWICKVQNNGCIGKDEGQANAQLIAHAPQMLEEHQNDIDILKSVIKSMPLGLQHLTNHLKEMVESKRQLIQSATATK